jgi:hypothetical protein
MVLVPFDSATRNEPSFCRSGSAETRIAETVRRSPLMRSTCSFGLLSFTIRA